MKDDNPDRDAMALISARLREQGADEYWRRLFHKDETTLEFAGRLTAERIDVFTQALWFAREFKQPWLENLVHDAIALSSSKSGKAREEAVKAMTGSVEQRTRSLLRLRRIQ